MSKRFRLVQSLTQSALWSSIHAWRQSHREASEQEAAVHIVSCTYGATLAQRVQEALQRREHWQVQPIDLIAALLEAWAATLDVMETWRRALVDAGLRDA